MLPLGSSSSSNCSAAARARSDRVCATEDGILKVAEEEASSTAGLNLLIIDPYNFIDRSQEFGPWRNVYRDGTLGKPVYFGDLTQFSCG